MNIPLCSGQDLCHDLAFLPRDLFWLILELLKPTDLVRCRRVSRAWNEAFRNPDILLPLFKRHFPWTQEVKDLQKGSPNAKNFVQKTFDQVVARYDHLERGKPRSEQKHRLCSDLGWSWERQWFPVQPWESHASHYLGDVDRQFSESMWTYEDGLLVFPQAKHRYFVLLDLDSDRQFLVPFIIEGKVIRRVRLQKRLLVVEWAEPKAFHWLNESDGVHRHFASSFDVTPSAGDDGGWEIIPRNEWKIMFLGHPLSERDRFFSAHSKTHYVIYIWQPNRSLYTADEDAPIESLFVWDISQQSNYRPSLDPTGAQTGPEVDQAPSILARFGYQDLEFFNVRQRGFPCIQQLEVSDDGQTVYITENARIFPVNEQPQAWGVPQTVTVGIPVNGIGPCARISPGFILTAYRSNDNFQQMPLYEWDHLVDSWNSIIAQVTDLQSGVIFRLHFEDNVETGDLGSIHLTIETEKMLATRKAPDFSGRAKLCGCDKYIIGEARNRDLVIYRFDR
jgi:hypothetical protein